MSASFSFEALARQISDLRPAPASALPSRKQAERFVTDLLSLLFPVLSSNGPESLIDPAKYLATIAQELRTLLESLASRSKTPPEKAVDSFFADLPALLKLMQGDAKAIYEGDPAAESVDEVIVAYPGFLAIAIQRIAHRFYGMGIPVFPRILTEIGHQLTAVDIHPGARLGSNFCIDHATGIVIGETCEIGDNVKIYQGVTLGALSVVKGLAGRKRHPTIEDCVVIYSNATILGGETVVGHDSTIGGNVWLTTSVPPHSKVYQQSEVRIRNGTSEAHT